MQLSKNTSRSSSGSGIPSFYSSHLKEKLFFPLAGFSIGEWKSYVWLHETQVLFWKESETLCFQVRFRLELVGLTGLEPVTLRLSSVCSNQLSYRPFLSVDGLFLFVFWIVGGGKGIRTPDIQLAKLALYQLSYTPLFFRMSVQEKAIFQQSIYFVDLEQTKKVLRCFVSCKNWIVRYRFDY